jgi:hypothetical protein
VKLIFQLVSFKIILLINNTNIFQGWFVDDTTSNDADIEVFPKALSAAINLTDYFSWPKNQLSFQSVYENVSVCINPNSDLSELYLSYK